MEAIVHHPIMKPAIIDVESSGLGSNSYPIEIGVSLSSGDRYCSLIRPEPEWTSWDSEAEKLHGISRQMLLSRGKHVVEVAQDLNGLLEDQTVFSDGWVVDQRWVAQLFAAASIPQRFYVSPLETILTEEQMTIWHQTKEKVIRELKLKRHRASADAQIIQETFDRTQALFKR